MSPRVVWRVHYSILVAHVNAKVSGRAPVFLFFLWFPSKRDSVLPRKVPSTVNEAVTAIFFLTTTTDVTLRQQIAVSRT